MQLVSKNKTSPNLEVIPPEYIARLTLPVKEELVRAGATVVSLETGYYIQLGNKMPQGIVAVHLNGNPYLGLRKENEPPYPEEFPDFWSQVDFTPCPVCQAPVIWWEAGFVPGYRLCIAPPHHHSIVKEIK